MKLEIFLFSKISLFQVPYLTKTFVNPEQKKSYSKPNTSAESQINTLSSNGYLDSQCLKVIYIFDFKLKNYFIKIYLNPVVVYMGQGW